MLRWPPYRETDERRYDLIVVRATSRKQMGDSAVTVAMPGGDRVANPLALCAGFAPRTGRVRQVSGPPFARDRPFSVSAGTGVSAISFSDRATDSTTSCHNRSPSSALACVGSPTTPLDE